jgi:hypothetical protein
MIIGELHMRSSSRQLPLTPNTSLYDNSEAQDLANEMSDNHVREANSKIATLLGASAFFTFFITTRSLPQFLSSLAGKILLPFTAASSILGVVFEWQEYEKKKLANGGIANGFYSLVVDALVATGISLSVLSAFFVSTAAAPIILVSALAIKSAFEFALGVKDFMSARALLKHVGGHPNTEESKAEISSLYRSSGKHFLNFGFTSVIAASFALMAASYAAFTYMGLIASGVAGVVENAYKEGDANFAIKREKEVLVSSTTSTVRSLEVEEALRNQHRLSVVSGPAYANMQTTVIDSSTVKPRRDRAEPNVTASEAHTHRDAEVAKERIEVIHSQESGMRRRRP